jgi:hypothetical protein
MASVENKAETFRKRAAEARNVAARVMDEKEKRELLRLAEQWERLAMRARAEDKGASWPPRRTSPLRNTE